MVLLSLSDRVRQRDSYTGASEGKSKGKTKRNVTVFTELHENRSVGAYNTDICFRMSGWRQAHLAHMLFCTMTQQP